MRITVSTGVKAKVDRLQYWQAAWISMSKPHLIYKRLSGQNVLQVFHCPTYTTDFMLMKIQHIGRNTSNNFEQDILNSLSSESYLKPCTLYDSQVISDSCYLVVRRLILKNKNYSKPVEISFINYNSNEFLSYLVQEKPENAHLFLFPFILQWNDGEICAKVEKDLTKTTSKWLEFHFLPKLVKWASTAESKDIYYDKPNSSLQLIDIDKYNELYFHWKEKYGRKLVETWTESTDPSKFVYEDIAIATYLHLLWNRRSVKFVDLGCGNGLLVHILTEEGHEGRGIDIRARKIWSLYPSNTILEIGTVTPDNFCFFPEADWIIGNHSDELTPWIPIFATRSSLLCSVFLLPCCAYELNGQKFQRRNASLSTYNDHIEYVKSICKELDFDVVTDKLRIPSTKRLCIIGSRTTVLHEKEINIKVQKVLNEFKPCDLKLRAAIEKVRNCTKVDRIITDKICNIISNELIQKQLAEKRLGNSVWSNVCSMDLQEAVTLISSTDLKKLKNECGGLKTMLKNNHSVFMIQHGRIHFRKPFKRENITKWKQKPCWFFHNHPFNCPLLESECSYIH